MSQERVTKNMKSSLTESIGINRGGSGPSAAASRTSALGASFFFCSSLPRKGCEQEWHSRGFK